MVPNLLVSEHVLWASKVNSRSSFQLSQDKAQTGEDAVLHPVESKKMDRICKEDRD